MTECGSEEFVRALAEYLRILPLSPAITNEQELKTEIAAATREYVMQRLGTRARVYFARAREEATKQDRDEWTRSKRLQNVTVYGSQNTGDIFVCDDVSSKNGVSIELEFAKSRGKRNATTLPGILQHALGQSIIASLRHRVICLIVCQRFLPIDTATEEHKKDRSERRLDHAYEFGVG